MQETQEQLSLVTPVVSPLRLREFSKKFTYSAYVLTNNRTKASFQVEGQLYAARRGPRRGRFGGYNGFGNNGGFGGNISRKTPGNSPPSVI